jgi:type II secretory pathway component GspD/PulD (secretin)/tetratricopeptide (TPR) repeat protein
MMKAATLPLGLTLLLATLPAAYAQSADQDLAVREAVYRQANVLYLRNALVKARDAQERGDLAVAAKLYDDAWDLAQKIGSGVDQESQQTKAGLGAVRLQLARSAQRRGNLREAKVQIDDALRVDPANALAIEFRLGNDKLLAESKNKMPSEDVERMVPAVVANKSKAAQLVQDGKLLYEMGKLDEAETKLKLARKEDPENDGAYYYLNLVSEARYHTAINERDLASRDKLGNDIEKKWAIDTRRDSLPQPNPWARTNLIFTGRGRQLIVSKLDRIRLAEVKAMDNLPLSEVVKMLDDLARKSDPEERGINFIIAPYADAAAAGPTGPAATDPATGLPMSAQGAEPVDMNSIGVRFTPALHDIRLADFLEIIVKVADKPIKYSIEDYAVVFSPKGRETTPLYFRTIKVDPNTFVQGMMGVSALDWGTMLMSMAGSSSSGGSGGGGGGGGGMMGGGMGGMGGGMGGGGGGGLAPVARVSIAGSSMMGGMGGGMGGGAMGGAGGAGGVGGGGGGVQFVTRTNSTAFVQAGVRNYFTLLGVDLAPPKSVFFNDRDGTLLIYASLSDLDIIERAIQVLNLAPPMVNVKSKFVEVTQNDTRGFGFEWYLGNVLMGNGAVVGSGGTQPTLTGAPSAANPGSFFPTGSYTAPSASDGNITSGVRATANNLPTLPALASFTGILTDPQFKVVISALQQRDGVDFLSESQVTTLSGRQTECMVVDIQDIVLSNSLTSNNGNSSTTSGLGTTINNTGSGITPYATELPFGPTLDVLPTVSADGYSVQMTLIPSIMEFIGYDDPGPFATTLVPAGSTVPIVAALPLPHFRVRQVVTCVNVWDGQTVVLGGLVTENVSKMKDQVPILGDLPVVGRLFRTEINQSTRKNLLIFVTPTIIDPAGNRFHSEDEMPYVQNSFPAQPKTTATPPVQQ